MKGSRHSVRRRNGATAALVALGLTIAPAAGGPIDGSKPLLCVLSRISSCSSAEACQGETPDSVNLPRFLRLDFGAKTISGTRPDGTKRTTPIGSVQHLPDGLVLQGVDEGPLIWSIEIAQPTGGMALAGIKGDLGFVIFGDCTAQ
jgi:hypothetical protein